ncbi:MAG: hypothetical protein DWQ47_05695 [Acidobacteria bacterium]|nr:MAG: hypothetical protein DWQ32_09245 [Acidobacteriota bacterium]REK01872.1 MAG: hypothetical protein DWQ38_05680 [Acidobacteriota bacterium]REK14828.1 MAG: hypothetical protein DWQ43_14935 [Acidobacteriota bacterium]REK45543.1 MAG: hypothetical protein DWQ47_05695 [Acidobacteriota bacterium]
MRESEFRTGVIKPIECFKEGWEAIKPHYWLLFAITLIGMLIGGFSFYILLGAMVCGIFVCYFRALDGQEVAIEDLFKGFEYFWPGLILTAIIVLPGFILFGLMYAPLVIATMGGSVLSQDEFLALLSGFIVVELIFAIIMACLHTLVMFSYPLIVDRKLSAFRAIIVSSKAVLKNLKGVAGLWVASFVAAIAGYLALCVGVYFVIPVIFAANIAAYRKVFPRLEVQMDGPPPPDSYEAA